MTSTRAALAAFVLLGAAGCGMVESAHDAIRDAEAVSGDLERATGVRPQVGFQWNNGRYTNVTVVYEGIPAGHHAQDIATIARRAVALRFGEAPEQITLSFVVSGEPPTTGAATAR
ncbi:hypothetical protein SD81_038780 [Tolypothrix campylonemoides VB511288]|nr:hypothetical protein SD81_038780 [Tolypothrix campylonemoides VB511288]